MEHYFVFLLFASYNWTRYRLVFFLHCRTHVPVISLAINTAQFFFLPLFSHTSFPVYLLLSHSTTIEEHWAIPTFSEAKEKKTLCTIKNIFQVFLVSVGIWVCFLALADVLHTYVQCCIHSWTRKKRAKTIEDFAEPRKKISTGLAD